MTPLDAETRAHLHYLILEAHRTLPQLAVTLTPHTNGKQWIVDHCCTRAWVYERLEPDPLLRAVRAALTELKQARRTMRGVIPQQRASSPVLAT